MSSRFLPRKEIACSVGVFRVFANIARSIRFAAMLVYKKLPLPWILFRLFPSLFRVRIQDGARLIKMPLLAKIRLNCRLYYSINLLVGVHNLIYFLQRPKEAATFCKHSHTVRILFTKEKIVSCVASMKTAVAIERWQTYRAVDIMCPSQEKIEITD